MVNHSINMKIYVISLPHAQLRRENAAKQLIDCKYPWQFVDAVTSDSDEVREMMEKSERVSLWHKPLRGGEVACYLSHRKVWQMMGDEGITHGLVLEDDFCLETDINHMVAILLGFKHSYDMIKLNGRPKLSRVVESIDCDGERFDLIKPFAPTGITVGQWVHARSLPRLLDRSRQIRRPIDMDLKHYWEYPLELYHIRPLMVGEMSAELGGSTILHRKQPKTFASQMRRWKQKLSFYWNCAIHYGDR